MNDPKPPPLHDPHSYLHEPSPYPEEGYSDAQFLRDLSRCRLTREHRPQERKPVKMRPWEKAPEKG